MSKTSKRRDAFVRYRAIVVRGTAIAVAVVMAGVSDVQGGPAPGTPFARLAVPPGVPAWLLPSWHALLNAPLASVIGPTPVLPPVMPATTQDPDPAGWVGTYQPNGPTATTGNAFFQSLGSNGRACATCHLPANGMSISVGAIQAQFAAYGFNNPLFAPVDGATCPSNVPAANRRASPVNALVGGSAWSSLSPYQLLLTKGLFRIALPVPKTADFTVGVARDPYGCNTDPQFTQVTDPTSGAQSQILSVYRRPLMAANLKFKTTTAANTGLFPGTGLPVDPYTGGFESRNIMWDGREATLQSQATDATLGHAQALNAPTAAQVAQIVAFESGVYAAQVYDTVAQSLTSGAVAPNRADGGPITIANTAPATAPPGVGTSTFEIYAMPYAGPSNPTNDKRASIIRGQALFDGKTFQVSNVAGLNDIPGFGNPATITCSGCHHQINAGTDAAPNAAFDLGIGGTSQAFSGPAPAADLPVFTFTCKPGSTTSFHNASVVTNDPGVGLISGKCADVGKFIVPDLRALAARAPYFHDGSAASLADVVEFYNARFRIGFSAQDKVDLTNFLNAL